MMPYVHYQENAQFIACGYNITTIFNADTNQNILIPRGVEVTIYMDRDSQ